MTYFGNDIGEASRAEERALERRLNLELSNRDFLARERARADAIDEANARSAQHAYLSALGLEQADRGARANLALAMSDRDYGRGLQAYQTRLGLEEAEKGRELQRELYGLRAKQYQETMADRENDRLSADIAKRIEAGNIPDVPALQEAEGGRLSSADWVDLKTRLGQHQQRMAAEEEIGPQQAAREASLALQSHPAFKAAGEDADLRRVALDQVMRELEKSRVYQGKLRPNYGTLQFEPRLDYKHSIGRDAIDWYSPNPRPAPVYDPGGSAYGPRLGMETALGAMGDGEGERAPVTTPAVESVNPRVARVKALVAQGVPYAEAVARVRAER